MGSTKKTSKSNYQPRQQRIFSQELKKKLVEEIEKKRLKVRDVVNLYKVTDTSVYKWLKQYSSTIPAGAKMVVESESKETKTDKLMNHIADLERALGKKQLEVEFLNKVIEICSEKLGYDVKKKNITLQ